MKRVELHSHSTFSDGTCPPEEVVARAAKAGTDLLVLTDHDSVSGGPRALAAAAALGVRAFVGIEINTVDKDRVHILGYGFRPDSPGFPGRLEEFRERRVARARLIVEKLRALGLPLDYEDVRACAHEALGRPHVADALRRKGLVKSRREAFDRFLAKGKPGYVEPMGPSAAEAIALIREAGGFACLAHPETAGGEEDLEALFKAGLEGVETRYSTHTPSQMLHYADWAGRRGLVETGGTDFHGPGTGRDARLGVEVDDSFWGDFLERLSRC